MAGKKGKLPPHVTPKQFLHPGIEHPVIRLLDKVEDVRQPSISFSYCLTSVLFMIITAILCGAKDWPQVVVMSEGMVDWLARYVDMSSGVPCERTFKNLINSLNQDAMEDVLRELSNLIRQKIPQEVVSIDGQTARGTSEKAIGDKIHLLNAWSAENRLCLGQLKVDDKSNEIPSVPQLMDLLDLQGTIVTTDALNTQTVNAAKAIEKGADYIFPVKGNQPSLLEEIILAFKGVDADRKIAQEQWQYAVAKAKEHKDEPRLSKLLTNGPNTCGVFRYTSEVEKAHGRIETRSCMAIPAGDLPCRNNWKGLSSLIRIERQRILDGKTSQETVYYISSLSASNAKLIADAVRKHWSIEGNLHWYLDVVFKQDKSRYRDRVGACNLAAIRKIALNALTRETSRKGSIATKQAAAAVNPLYRDKILKNLF